MKIDFQDRIDDYLLDRMSEEERKSFESDVAADAELKEQLGFTETVLQATRSRNEKLAAMEEWKDDYVWENDEIEAASATEYRATGSGYDSCPAPATEEPRSASRSSGRQFFYWLSGIAAMFVLGVFLIRNVDMGSSSVDCMSPHSMNEMAFRAGSDNSEIELLLSQKKYEEALSLIEDKYLAVKEDSLTIVQDSTIETERKEYDMQLVMDKQNDLKWLKVHALLGLTQQEAALRLLEELRKEKGYYQMAADSLYNHLSK